MVQISESKRGLSMRKIGLVAITLAVNIASANLLEEASKLDVKTVCDVKVNGLEKVIAVAEKFNPEAIKLGVEF
jgi:hypothetical protein